MSKLSQFPVDLIQYFQQMLTRGSCQFWANKLFSCPLVWQALKQSSSGFVNINEPILLI